MTSRVVVTVTLLLGLFSLVGVRFTPTANAASQVQVTVGDNELRVDRPGRISLYVGHQHLLLPLVSYEEFLLRKQDWSVVSCSGTKVERIERGAEVTCQYGGVDVVKKTITLSPGELTMQIDVNLPPGRFREIRRLFHQLRLSDGLFTGASYVAKSGEDVLTGKLEPSGQLNQGFLTNLNSLKLATQAGRVKFTFAAKTDWQADDLSNGTMGKPYFRLQRSEWMADAQAGVSEQYTVAISLPHRDSADSSDPITVNAYEPLRPINPRALGTNMHAFYWGKTRRWQLQEQYPVIDRLREAGIGALRYPGGDRADFWHWRKPMEGGQFFSAGIQGSTSEPYATTNPNNVTDTDEFAQFSSTVGAVPLIIANVQTGTAQEAADWVRYSNVEHAYNFRYWEVGNEEHFRDPLTYVAAYRQYAPAMKAVDPTLLVGANVGPLVAASSGASGFTGLPVEDNDLLTQYNNWLPTIVSAAGNLMDFFNAHYYPSSNLSYGALFENALGLGQRIDQLRAALSDLTGRPDPRIVIAEWGWQWPSFGRGIFAAITLGELSKSGVDLSCYYDYDGWADWSLFSQMYSGQYKWEPHMPGANPLRRPTYWALYLWNKMKGDLVETTENAPYAPVAVYAATDASAVRVMLINKSGWDKSVPLEVKGVSSSKQPKGWVLQSTPDRLGASGLDSVECTLNGQPVVSLGVPTSVPAMSLPASPYIAPAYSITLFEFEK